MGGIQGDKLNLKPLFSIIIPVYQSESTLNRCISSVLRQKENNYEVILVDDGSTDGSGKICDDYAGKFPDIFSVIHKTNEGPQFARIDGINAARGQYLMFLDADDAYTPDLLKRIKTVIEARQADMLIFNYFRKFADGEVQLNKPLYLDGQQFEGKALLQLYTALITGPELNALWQKCICRTILPDLEQIRQNGSMIIGEDKLFSMALADNAERVVYLADGLYDYYIGEHSISHNLSLRHYKDMSKVYLQTLRYMSHWKLNHYRVFCCQYKVESGLSCLYSVVDKIQAHQKKYKDFTEMASYIIDDREYWNAFAFYRNKMSFYKRAACFMLRCRRIYVLFAYLYIGVLIRNIKKRIQK